MTHIDKFACQFSNYVTKTLHACNTKILSSNHHNFHPQQSINVKEASELEISVF